MCHRRGMKSALGFAVIVVAACVLVSTCRSGGAKPSPKPVIAGVATSGVSYFAAANGDDAAPCTLKQPCDLAKLLRVLKAGDVGYLRGGVYPGPITIRTTGMPTERIVIASYPPDGLYAAT